MTPRPDVRGLELDAATRCKHWHSPLDVIAIKMKCCGVYYACKDCHDALADHPLQAWPRDAWGDKAVLCGACGSELSIRQYLHCGNVCPACGAGFNPGCRNHYHLYFERDLRALAQESGPGIDRPIRLPEQLSDGVVVLDGYQLADAEAHLAGEDAEMLRRFEAPRQATLDEMRVSIQRWIDARAAGGPNFCYAMRLPSGILIGGCEVRWLPHDALNVSYWLFPQYRGQGSAGRAMTLLCDAVASIPGLKQVEAHVDADNAASRHVAERAGFVQNGSVVDDAANGDGAITRVRYVRTIA